MSDVSTLMALADAFADEESLRVRAQLRDALESAITKLAEQAQADARDAERYRWLRDNQIERFPAKYNGNQSARFDMYWEAENENLDAAIDSAQGEKSPPPHLREEAPFLRCTTCGRKSWSCSVGDMCGLVQPDGTNCKGQLYGQ